MRNGKVNREQRLDWYLQFKSEICLLLFQLHHTFLQFLNRSFARFQCGLPVLLLCQESDTTLLCLGTGSLLLHEQLAVRVKTWEFK